MQRSLVTQSRRHALSERGNDLYETPPEATLALMRVERLPQHIWEPACGRGAIVNVLRAAGHDVPRATNAIPFMWAVWDAAHAGPPALHRISWERGP